MHGLARGKRGRWHQILTYRGTILVRNAVAVLVILMAIAVVTFLAYLGLNAANRGGENMAETVAAFDARTYETYDQTTVSGTTALAAVKNFRNRSVTVVVRTTGDTVYRVYCANYMAADPGVVAHTTTIATAAGVGAVISGTAANHNVSGIRAATGVNMWPLSQNTSITSATNKSLTSYINPTAKFRSVLIFNANNEPIGILLEQVGMTGGLL